MDRVFLNPMWASCAEQSLFCCRGSGAAKYLIMEVWHTVREFAFWSFERQTVARLVLVRPSMQCSLRTVWAAADPETSQGGGPAGGVLAATQRAGGAAATAVERWQRRGLWAYWALWRALLPGPLTAGAHRAFAFIPLPTLLRGRALSTGSGSLFTKTQLQTRSAPLLRGRRWKETAHPASTGTFPAVATAAASLTVVRNAGTL